MENKEHQSHRLPLRVGKKDPWQHLTDTCTCFTQARIVNGRTTHSILQGLQDIWVRPFGPQRIK
eukprot:3308890-Prorocentrum_lima.AAC.1